MGRFGPVFVVAASLALVIPFAARAFDFTGSIELSLMLPRGCASADAFTQMQRSFGDGTVFPYQLLLTTSESGTAREGVWEPAFFAAAQALVQDLVRTVPNTQKENFVSAAYLPQNIILF